ncbi:MAG: export transporter permease LptF [Pseudomonadota bacterium]
MSRFDRYLLSQLLAMFGFFALILVAVYWINRAVGLFDRLLGDGHSLLVFLELSLLMVPNVIRLMLPIAAFAASVYVTNRLTQESELVVMQATGFSAFRLARPVMVFGIIVTVMHLVLINLLVPWSNAILSERNEELSENITARFLNEGRFLHPTAGVTLYIREITPQGELHDVFLADDRSDAERTTYTARRALLARSDAGPKLLMFDGIVQRLTGTERQMSVTRFSDFTYDLAELFDIGAPRPVTLTALTSWQLMTMSRSQIQDLGYGRASVNEELANRVSQPLLSLTTALVGFSALLIGAFSRFGLWRQIGLAVLILIFLQLLNTTGSSLALANPRALPAQFMAPAVGLGIAALLLWQSQRPRHLRGPGRVAAA